LKWKGTSVAWPLSEHLYRHKCCFAIPLGRVEFKGLKDSKPGKMQRNSRKNKEMEGKKIDREGIRKEKWKLNLRKSREESQKQDTKGREKIK